MCIVQEVGLQGPEQYMCAQAGCAKCLETLLQQHRRLVHAVIKRQWAGSVVYADLEQAGSLGLWRAIMGYDPAQGWTFSTYAWVTSEILQSHTDQHGKHR